MHFLDVLTITLTGLLIGNELAVSASVNSGHQALGLARVFGVLGAKSLVQCGFFDVNAIHQRRQRRHNRDRQS